MFKVIFSLDYEIHGNGDGDPDALMVEPTWRLLKILEEYGARLTVFADVAQIAKYREYYEKTGEDRFSYLKIEEQLKYCVRNSHDVQLHIHSSFYNSGFNGKKWVQDWSEYDLASLDFEVINQYVRSGKHLLEDMLCGESPEYRCHVFRAANWSMQPGLNILKALERNGFNVDSSVYKWGRQSSNVNYDYSHAFQQILPYPVCMHSVTDFCGDSPIFEVPIYCERRYTYEFITLIRVFRAIRALFHKHEKAPGRRNAERKKGRAAKWINRAVKLHQLLFSKHPRKLDLNQLSSKQQIGELKRIAKKYSGHPIDVPIVFIGHSKTFISRNEKILEKTLQHINHQRDFGYAVYGDIPLEPYRIFHEKHNHSIT